LVLFGNLKVSPLEVGLRERGGGGGEASASTVEVLVAMVTAVVMARARARAAVMARQRHRGSMGARDGGEPRQKKKRKQHLLSNLCTYVTVDK
jgi:hypothetical protein